MARQMTAPMDLFVDPAAIAADVFNVDFTLTSADALIAQLETAVSLDAAKSTSRQSATRERGDPSPATRLRTDSSPFATASIVAQVLQESVAQLSEVEPFEAVRDNGCDYRTLVTQIKNSVAVITKELTKPEPLGDRVQFHLKSLTGYEPGKRVAEQTEGSDLHTLGKRLGVAEEACSVKDERTLTAFLSVVQVTFMVEQAWEMAQAVRPYSLTAAMPSLQRSLRGIVLASEELRQAVPSSAWITYQIQTEPPIIAWDLYQWIHDEASVGALNDLKQGARDGIRNVNVKIARIKQLVESTLRVPAPDDATTDPCKAAFNKKKVQTIVEELICLMDQVIDVTNKLLQGRATS